MKIGMSRPKKSLQVLDLNPALDLHLRDSPEGALQR